MNGHRNRRRSRRLAVGVTTIALAIGQPGWPLPRPAEFVTRPFAGQKSAKYEGEGSSPQTKGAPPALPWWLGLCGENRLFADENQEQPSPVARKDRADAPSSTNSPIGDDLQDVVLLFTARPLVMRLHLRVEGHGFRKLWREQSRRGENAGESRDPQRAPLIDDSPLVVRETLGLGRRAGPALFPLIDTDQDNRLSRDELQHAARAVVSRDFDDNGLIGQDELILDKSAAAGDVATRASVFAIDPDRGMLSVVSAVIARYDLNGDRQLTSPDEVVFPQSLFSEADVNHDQRLDAAELSTYLAKHIDVELTFSFGRQGSVDGWGILADDVRVRKKIGGGFKVTLADAAIDFRRNNRNPAENTPPVNLAMYDQDGNGYLDASEAQVGDLAAYPFVEIDVDADGKIFAAELEEFLLRRSQLAARQILLEVSDQGQELFTLLDENQDGLLSPRELRQAAATLSVRDLNRNGLIEAGELSHEVQMEIGRGLDPLGLVGPINRSRSRSPERTADDGPLWFRKMDRNGDGDISRQEFSGSSSQFAALDRDGDGLISLAEGLAASAGDSTRSESVPAAE